jgi:hypothetical protein
MLLGDRIVHLAEVKGNRLGFSSILDALGMPTFIFDEAGRSQSGAFLGLRRGYNLHDGGTKTERSGEIERQG